MRSHRRRRRRRHRNKARQQSRSVLRTDKRTIQLGIGYLGPGVPNGWDGRNATLEAQARSSIATGSMSMRETDTPVKVEVIEERIRAIPDYVVQFKAALPDAPINLESMATAIAAYERTLDPGPAALRPLGRR